MTTHVLGMGGGAGVLGDADALFSGARVLRALTSRLRPDEPPRVELLRPATPAPVDDARRFAAFAREHEGILRATALREALASGPLYYAEAGKVWKRPITTQKANGTKTCTLGFPVCTMHEAVGDDAAEIVAKLMNAGHEATKDEPETT